MFIYVRVCYLSIYLSITIIIISQISFVFSSLVSKFSFSTPAPTLSCAYDTKAAWRAHPPQNYARRLNKNNNYQTNFNRFVPSTLWICTSRYIFDRTRSAWGFFFVRINGLYFAVSRIICFGCFNINAYILKEIIIKFNIFFSFSFLFENIPLNHFLKHVQLIFFLL